MTRQLFRLNTVYSINLISYGETRCLAVFLTHQSIWWWWWCKKKDTRFSAKHSPFCFRPRSALPRTALKSYAAPDNVDKTEIEKHFPCYVWKIISKIFKVTFCELNCTFSDMGSRWQIRLSRAHCLGQRWYFFIEEPADLLEKLKIKSDTNFVQQSRFHVSGQTFHYNMSVLLS